MSTTEKLLQVDPQNELLFRGPFHLPSAAFIRLTNVSDRRVLFKIKTTAPKKYCVRPNAGILMPSNHVDIVLSLQPFSYDPQEKNKHKFLIQSAVAPTDDDINMEQVWRNIPVEEIVDTKLRCVFEVPEDSKVTTEVNTPPLLINNSADSDSKGNNDLHRVTNELQYLREERWQIKEENIRLKAEIVQLKSDIEATVTPPQSSVSVKAETTIPYAVIFSGVFLGIIGYFLGKFGFKLNRYP